MPFVPQAVLDAMSETVQTLRTTLTQKEAAYDALLARYHELQLAGGRPPVVPREPKPVDVVSEAIGRRAAGQPRQRELRGAMSRWVAEQRMLGVAEDVIAAQITAGVDAADDGVPL